MPREVNEVDVLQQYIGGVMGRAEHHAKEVDEVVLAIVGAVVWRKEGAIRVLEREGKLENMMWVEIRGNPYTLSYNHDDHVIEVRQGNARGGPVVASFDNNTPQARVKEFFGGL